MKGPPFSDSIWGIRLQTLWILFTAIYSASGEFVPRRVVSSWMILVAGVLLLAVFAHVIISTDVDRIRRMLIVVLTASLFIVNTAVHAFKDYVAAGFAGLFAMMLATLLWRSRVDQSFKRFQYLCFVSMSLAVVAGAIGLVATLGLKDMIGHGWVDARFYVYAPMETATMCGFSVGCLLNGRILSNRIMGYVPIPSLRTSTVILRACVLAMISGTVLAVANASRMGRVGGLTRGELFGTLYSLCFIVPMAFYLGRLHSRSVAGPLFSWRTLGVLSLWGLAASVPAGAIMAIAAKPGMFLHRWAGAEGPTGIMVGVSVGIGFYCVNRLSDTIMANDGGWQVSPPQA